MKFKWRYIAEGTIEAPSKEIVQAAVINQVSIATNLCLGLTGVKVEAEAETLVKRV